MTLIPGRENAFIDVESKLRGYCLNKQHPVGKNKAKVFDAALKITDKEAEKLRDFILAALETNNATAKMKDEHGERYELRFIVLNEGKPVEVLTAWIIREGEDFPRLTTCYVV